MATVDATSGTDARRADRVLWHLRERLKLGEDHVHQPQHRVRVSALCRVHTPALLERLEEPEELARIFGVETWDLPLEETLTSIRLACQGTLEATQFALKHHTTTLNLSGGMHHASPERSGGYCPVNDIAVAVAAVRADGFGGLVVVLDLDAHPPDGTADCFKDDPATWIGSLSGVDWGQLPTVDETVLVGADDTTYLAALDALLARMPQAELALVLAGGDVLSQDRHGNLNLTIAGARERDRRVAAALRPRVPSVWLPAGGYHADSWRVTANTAAILMWDESAPLARGNPMRRHFALLSDGMDPDDLTGAPFLTEADLAEAMGVTPQRSRLLGYYTVHGVELGLEHFGISPHLRRLGYDPLEVELGLATEGERCRVFGMADGRRHLLVELVVEATEVAGERALFVNWLTLRHPATAFARGTPALPGQEVPGLGLARETAELLRRIAQRLNLRGVAIVPAWYHVAYAARHDMHFVDPQRQGRLQALVRDLAGVALQEATRAVAEDRVLLDGEPYIWEAVPMVTWDLGDDWRTQAATARDGVTFSLAPADA
ncbi:MAG: acetoin utilization deacetylase AcuC-like enzyme [Myxococcota bacterium]|jgi:acetoin utilization deacetylase AcuC-like enzyme